MLNTKIKYDYDSEEDILYLSIGEPKPSVTEEIEEGILIRKDIETGEITGVTILDYKDRIDKNEKINIPKEFDLPFVLSLSNFLYKGLTENKKCDNIVKELVL